MNKTSAKAEVLAYAVLFPKEYTPSGLARELGKPAPSVRRDLATLRKDGLVAHIAVAATIKGRLLYEDVFAEDIARENAVTVPAGLHLGDSLSWKKIPDTKAFAKDLRGKWGLYVSKHGTGHRPIRTMLVMTKDEPVMLTDGTDFVLHPVHLK